MRILDGQLQLAATDLSNFLACRHLTRLDTLKSQGYLSPAKQFDIGFQDLIKRGEAHEKRVLDLLAEEGRVTEIPTTVDITDADKSRLTVDAIAAGVDVIYQGVLLLENSSGIRLLGRPDFLVRADLLRLRTGPDKEAIGYEVVDAKLARTAKARAVLQSVFYCYLLSEVQGGGPERLHLALGNGELVPFRVADFAAYERRIRSYLEDFLLEDLGDYPDIEPYPEPVEHCAICRWRADCTRKRRDDDDLSLIAGMPTTQRVALKAIGVSRRRQFAELETLPDHLRGTNLDSLRRSQLQAQLQVESEDAGQTTYLLLEPDRDDGGALVPNRGLLALPEPSKGDLFFDIEGTRYYSEDGKEYGLQYLFGIVDSADLDAGGTPRYTQIWSFDRDGEKTAFEELIDFITVRRTANPELHVYHYNHYEPTSLDHLTELHETREEALGRLMGRFATHEDAVDDLFRLGVFVDLYRVVRQGLRAGVESYSIKRLEKLIGFERIVDLENATENLIAFDLALDEGEAAEDLETRTVVAGYNEDDCRATLALRNWLEARRVELGARVGEPLPRPVAPDEDDAHGDPDVVRLKGSLMAGIPDDLAERTEEEKARSLLADLLEWHRREAKPAWWRYFTLRTMSSVDLVGEPEAIGELEGGEIVGKVKRSTVRRFEFPPQEHGFDSGDTAEDPVSKKTWTVVAIDEELGTIDLKIGSTNAPLPAAIIEGGPINTKKLEARLRDLAERVVLSGFNVADAASALLLRLRPNTGESERSPLRNDEEPAGEAAQRIILGLTGSYLPIQGPPGSGKTFTAARAILGLVGTGHTVGVTAPSHAVIRNLLDEVVKQAARHDRTIRIGQRPDGDERFLHPSAESLDYAQLVAKLENDELDIVAGTAWLWAREEFADSVDTLVVDEAGQISLANVLAITGATSNLVLLGDPQQLAQPSQGAHPPGAELSALGHVLGEHDTMPDSAGIFLNRTYRMHPDLCRYTSEVFYDNRLDGIDGLEYQRISGTSWTLSQTGLTFFEVDHQGNANASPEEAAEVVRLVQELIGTTWIDRNQAERLMTPVDVLVVTPFNAQVHEIDNALAEAGIAGMRVGTVDKFQGQEAPAVVYSMASSSSADAPRGLEFLFDLHRLNVATSRARAVAVLLASPDLLRVFCNTPRQMVLTNALCRAWEA